MDTGESSEPKTTAASTAHVEKAGVPWKIRLEYQSSLTKTMNKPRPRHVVLVSVLVDSALFVAAAFAANYLINKGMKAYTLGAFALFIAYIGFRWFVLRPDWYRVNIFERLSDHIADSAEAYGVTDFYNMQIAADQNRRNIDTQQAISTANSMFLCANSGASYLNAAIARHRSYIIERLKAGCVFQVLLLDPLSHEKRLRDEVNVQGERADSKLSLGDIIRLCNDYLLLEVRFIDRGMTCSLFFANDVLFFDPYHLAYRDGRIENRFLCLRMVRVQPPGGVSYFDLFRSHRDVLWPRGVPIQEWLTRNRQRLERELNIRDLPELRSRPASTK